MAPGCPEPAHCQPDQKTAPDLRKRKSGDHFDCESFRLVSHFVTQRPRRRGPPVRCDCRLGVVGRGTGSGGPKPSRCRVHSAGRGLCAPVDRARSTRGMKCGSGVTRPVRSQSGVVSAGGAVPVHPAGDCNSTSRRSGQDGPGIASVLNRQMVDSHRALPSASPTVPIDPAMPASSNSAANATYLLGAASE
jgi:hypothetical protein